MEAALKLTDNLVSEARVEEIATAKGCELTRTRRAVATIMLDPAYAHATQAEKAAAAGVSPRTWWTIEHDPGFAETFNELLRESLRAKMSLVVDASFKTALLPGKEGYQDRKLIAEMAGTHASTERVINEGGIAVEYVSDWRAGAAQPGEK